MAQGQVDVSVDINNTPEAVMGYVADVRNRPLYLPSLKSVSDIQGDPSGADASWRWKWTLLGVELEGMGRCVEYEPGKKYVMKTEGGAESTFTYQAESVGEGTKLTISVQYDVPDTLLGRAGLNALMEEFKRCQADQAATNLKAILDQ